MQPKTQRSLVLPSQLESADVAEEAFQSFATAAGMPEGDRYFLGLAVREITINALRHGNGFDENKKVELHLTSDGEVLEILVNDEGAGFRIEDVPDPLAPENLNRPGGRGIRIAASVADSFTVGHRQPRGTEVRMVKSLKPQH